MPLRVGHFLFTERLMPALFAGAKTSTDHHARIITLSSSMALIGKIALDTIRDGPARRKMSGEAMYSQTKLVRRLRRQNLLLMAPLTRILPGECNCGS